MTYWYDFYQEFAFTDIPIADIVQILKPINKTDPI